MNEYLVWPIVFPMLAAIATFIIGNRFIFWGILPTILGNCFCAGALVKTVVQNGPQKYKIGGWGAPLGIELYADGLSATMIALTAIVGFFISLYALGYFHHKPTQKSSFWPLWLFLWGSLNALFLSNDIFNLYVTLELLTLIAIPLITLSSEKQALEAGMRYLLLAIVASLLYLLGVGFAYKQFGTLDILQLAQIVKADSGCWLAISLMTTGLMIKTALFPMHFWLPPAHSSAPSPVSALLSGLVVKGSFFILLKLWFIGFFKAANIAAFQLLGVLGAIAVVWGSIQALQQKRLKLLIAYSTVAQIGYLFLAFPIMVTFPKAYYGCIFFILSHAIAKSAIFLMAGNIIYQLGSDQLDKLHGTIHFLPWTFFPLAMAGISIMGMPPTGGFIAKWQLFFAAIKSGLWWWAIIIVIGGLMAAIYIFMVLSFGFTKVENKPKVKELPILMKMSPLVLSLLPIALCFVTHWCILLLQIGLPPFVRTGG